MLLGSFTDFLDFPRFSQEEAFASQPSDRSGRHAQGARGSGGWQLLSGSDPWWFFGKGVRGFWWLASSSNWGALKSPTEQFPTPPFSLGGVHGGSKQQARSSSISGKTHFKGSDGPDLFTTLCTGRILKKRSTKIVFLQHRQKSKIYICFL